MRWEDERYVRLYTREEPEWTLLPFEARLMWYELLKRFDRAGLLPLGRSHWKGVASVCRVPLTFVEVGLEALVEDGCLRLVSDGKGGELLFAPNFLAAQEAITSDAARQRASRERARDKAKAADLGVITPQDCDDDYTPSQDASDPSRAVTSGHSVPSLAVPSQPSDPENGASAPGPDGPCSSSMLAVSPSETTSSKPPASTPIQPSLPMPIDPVEPSDPALARPLQVTPATAVFQRYIDGWKTHVGGTRPPVLTEKRRNLIKSRIRDGFTHEDLLLAVAGIWLSTWNVSHAQHDFDLVLRDAAHVEKFRALAAPAKSAPGNTGAAALELWKTTYAKSKRAYGDYIAAPRDAEVAAKLAAQAREEAVAEVQRKGSGNLEQMAVLLLAHWFRQYLRTDGDKNRNVERRHPLAGLEFGIPQYGAPWGDAAKPKLDDGIRVPTRAESAAAVAALPQAAQATLASIGQGVASGMPTRPRFAAPAAAHSEPS